MKFYKKAIKATLFIAALPALLTILVAIILFRSFSLATIVFFEEIVESLVYCTAEAEKAFEAIKIKKGEIDETRKN